MLEQYMFEIADSIQMPQVFKAKNFDYLKVIELKTNKKPFKILNINSLYNTYDTFETEFVTHKDELKYCYSKLLFKDKEFLELLQHKTSKITLVTYITNTYDFSRFIIEYKGRNNLE